MLEVGYSGLLTAEGVAALGALVLPSRVGAEVTLERFDRALVALTDCVEVTAERHPGWLPPGAMVVPPDQMARATEFCARLAQRGVLRTAWRPEHLDHARRWCLAIERQSWPRSPPTAPEFCALAL